MVENEGKGALIRRGLVGVAGAERYSFLQSTPRFQIPLIVLPSCVHNRR